jgi:prevent-host-death family protein
MNNVRQFQDAKNELGEVIAWALKQGPQLIARNGEKIVAVISYGKYEKLRKSQGRLSTFFHSSPLAGVNLSRDESLPQGGFKI